MATLSTQSDSEFRDHLVRLFPCAHITSVKEAELRATASLLSMLKAVSEFGRAVTKIAGAPAGRVECFTEVPFKLQLGGAGDAKPVSLRPDGIINVQRGKTQWRALLEVKVGKSGLEQEQISKYHQLARDERFDALITVSSQAAESDSTPPISINRRWHKKVPVVHLSWDRLLSEAQVLAAKSGVKDTDQAWMLCEWIRYVTDSQSKIIVPPDLSPSWKTLMRAAKEGNLRTGGSALQDVVERWEDYLIKESLRLRAQLGVDVRPVYTRQDKADPKSRIRRLHDVALDKASLQGVLRIPDAIANLEIDVLLQARAVRCGVLLSAPTEGRQKARVAWLHRQLRNQPEVPDGLLITAEWDQRRRVSHCRWKDWREDKQLLLRDTHEQPIGKDVYPKRFRLELTQNLRRKEGANGVHVLEGVGEHVETFYRFVMQGLRGYVPKAPSMPPKTSAPAADRTVDNASESHVVAAIPAITELPIVALDVPTDVSTPGNGATAIQHSEEDESRSAIGIGQQ